MRVSCGHNNGFALVQQILCAVYGDLSDTVKAGDKGVAV